MQIKDWEYTNFLKDLKNYCSLLIFGNDRGLVKEKADLFLNSQKKSYNDKIEVFRLSPEDFSKKENLLYELAYQRPIFFKKTILHIDLDIMKNIAEITSFLEKVNHKSSNFLVLEAGNLKSDSKILKLFKKTKYFGLIACYLDNYKALYSSIKSYSKELGLNISSENIQLLCSKLGNNRLITKKEIEKLALFADNSPIGYSDILNGIGDNTTSKLDSLSDCLYIQNTYHINATLDKLIDDGINNIYIIRAIIKHLQLLFKLLLSEKKDMKSVMPPIHFSRHENIQKQLLNVNLTQIVFAISRIDKLEEACKKNPSIASIYLKKFFLSLSKN
tara:strand:- start:683 stop:1675 length:993 start_codon:yes stop_codon:yes gene_type:complete